MKNLPCFLALALLAPSLASANELTRVYGLALKNDTTLQAAMDQRDAAVQAKPIARAALLPQVNATGTFGRSDVSQTIANTTTDSQTNSTSYGAELTQVIFSREQWMRLRQSSDQVALAQAQYRNAQQGLALRTTTAYFNVLAAADSLRFADAEKKAVERQLELAKKRFEVGLSAITDVQEAQARYDLTVAQMIEAEQALSSAQVALSEITGSPDARIVPLKDEIPLLGPAPDSVNEWLKFAEDGNLDLQAAEINVAIARKDVSISGSKHWPTLSARASYDDSKTGGFIEEQKSTTVGVGLTVPIYAGGAVQAAVRRSEATYKQRQAELETARRAVERNTRNAYQGVIAGVSRVKALKQAVVSNTTALEASEVGLEVGARTAVDVLNAQRELFRAQRDYSKSRYDYLLNLLTLKSAAGRLGQKDLTEIDALLGAAGGT